MAFPASFDHLVGNSEQRRPYVKAEGLCRLEVNHQFVLCRCLHREVSRLLAPEDAIHVGGRAPELRTALLAKPGCRMHFCR